MMGNDCPKCGLKLEEGAQVCPRCNPAEAERLRKEKAKNRKIRIQHFPVSS